MFSDTTCIAVKIQTVIYMQLSHHGVMAREVNLNLNNRFKSIDFNYLFNFNLHHVISLFQSFSNLI